MKVAFLGATKGMGRALVRLMAERGDQMVLLGRDLADLDRSAQDLRIRGGQAESVFCDLEKPRSFALALDRTREVLGGVETVVVTAGAFAPQETLEADSESAARVLLTNFTNTVLFCEEARRRLLAAGGTLCVFSSVAGERGRKPVILYGASKAGLSTYLEGLDHKFRARGLKTVCVKPGFVHTTMTAGLKPPPFAADPADVAPAVLRAIDRGWPEVYVPGIWRWVMFVVRLLPRWVMRRVNF